MSPSQAPAEISRLLIVRLGSLGDIIHTLPAVSFLRRIYPAAVFGWAVEQRWVSLLSSESAIAAPRSPQKPLVDVVHVVDTLAWRSALLSDKTWRGVHDSLEELRSLPYDVAIDFQGAWKSAILAQLSRAPRRLGFAQPREKPATLFYTHQVPARGRHVVERNLSLAEGLSGAEPRFVEKEPPFPLPLDPAAERAADEQLRAHGFHSFVLINPGAGWGAKCWPAERYAEVARALARHGLRAIVNYGPGEEQLAGDVARASEGVAIALSPPLSELVVFSRRARLCIGGDTGPVHLAAAFGVPVVALFGPTDPARNGPCGGPSIVLRSDISRTTSSHHKEPDAGLLQISAAEVIAAARHLLAQPAEVRR